MTTYAHHICNQDTEVREPWASLVPRPSDWGEEGGGLVSTACACAFIIQILNNPITYGYRLYTFTDTFTVKYTENVAHAHAVDTVDFTCVRTLRVACMRPHMHIDQNPWLRTVMESKATPSRRIPWGSVKLHAINLLYASSHAKHGSSNASEIACTRPSPPPPPPGPLPIRRPGDEANHGRASCAPYRIAVNFRGRKLSRIA